MQELIVNGLLGAVTLAAAVLELCRVVQFQPVAGFVGRFLPFYSYGLGWVIPSVLGFIVGMAL